jgi:hypothetical protein
MPEVVYSSRNAAVAEEVRAADPSPKRIMTRSPAVNAAPCAARKVEKTTLLEVRSNRTFFITS